MRSAGASTCSRCAARRTAPRNVSRSTASSAPRPSKPAKRRSSCSSAPKPARFSSSASSRQARTSLGWRSPGRPASGEGRRLGDLQQQARREDALVRRRSRWIGSILVSSVIGGTVAGSSLGAGGRHCTVRAPLPPTPRRRPGRGDRWAARPPRLRLLVAEDRVVPGLLASPVSSIITCFTRVYPRTSTSTCPCRSPTA